MGKKDSMNSKIDVKRNIEAAIQNFGTKTISAAGICLFDALGYNTSLQDDLAEKNFDEFYESFVSSSVNKDAFNKEKALVDQWKVVDLLFQLNDDSFNAKKAFNSSLNPNDIQSYLCFAIELSGESYTKSEISNITREVNKIFMIPIVIIFKYSDKITLSIINRRLNKKDASKDVLEKVTLIKDISIATPFRAHIEILFDMSLDQLLQKKYKITNFASLHTAWSEVLDAQELNKRFYTELSNWYFWAVKTVVYPGAELEAEQNSFFAKDGKVREHNAKNLIRLLTRLLFVWFIKEKGLIPEEFFDESRIGEIITNFSPEKETQVGLENQSVYYKAILQNLFFASLNAEQGKRAFRLDDQNMNVTNLMRYKKYIHNPDAFVVLIEKTVPFMNGGLFECLDHVDDLKKGPHGGSAVIYEDGFSDRTDNKLYVPDYLFFGRGVPVDLSLEYGDKKKKEVKVDGLISILQGYKFTVAENTPIEEDIALDPELLGRVFENLLASYNPETGASARKQTGSFYTPRPIAEYMVDESLKAYLKSKMQDEYEGSVEDLEAKLATLIAYNDFTPDFSQPQKSKILKLLDNCKILDPACGSGAFPMGLLQKMVYIIHKLDPNNDEWKQIQVQKISSDASLEAKEKNQLQADLLSAFDENELDYARKLYLIENCIHGIDIQPIATQISRLRFFISLIVDQTVDSEKPNFGIRPLPNLENRFVTANSLVGLDKNSNTLGESSVEELKKQLKLVRHRLFNAKTPAYKAKLRQVDAQIRMEMESALCKNGFDAGMAEKLSSWDPYDKNKSASFFDAEWMFGIRDGFDIVIGNPPYVESRSPSFPEELKNQLQIQIQSRYKKKEDQDAFPRGADLMIFFYEMSLRMLNETGINTFITENSWLSTDYGKKFQQYLLRNVDIYGIIDSDFRYFENAQVNTVITFFRNIKCRKNNLVNLFYCHGNLSDHPCNVSNPNDNDDVIVVQSFNVDDDVIKKYKWGFLYKTEATLLDILRVLEKSQDRSFRKKIEIGQGLNLTNEDKLSEFVSGSVPYFVSDMGPLYCWDGPCYYVLENKISATRKIPKLIMPRGIGTYFCCYNDVRGYSASYVEIYEKQPLSDQQLKSLWFFCNSSILWLIRECSGRSNLGGGMLKAEATDLKLFPLCFAFDGNQMNSIFEEAKNCSLPTDISALIASPIHKKIDDFVFSQLGIENYKNEIQELLIKKIQQRMKKSKSIK